MELISLEKVHIANEMVLSCVKENGVTDKNYNNLKLN
jgi:hypothetical protein